MAQTAAMGERGPSTLASKNPFRNLIGDSKSVKPISTNPFLDSNEIAAADSAKIKTPTSAPNTATSPSSMSDKTADIFASLNVTDSSAPINGGSKRENMPPRPYPPRGPPRHRPSNSDEERRRQQGRPRAPPNELDIFADPPDLNRPREKRTAPRRNSESSIRDKSRPLDPEAEKRRRERKLREGRDGKSSTSSKSKKPSKRLDVIDKLDVTSIYGTGLFHHDGPFDACNPHRNRRGARQAPMQAFPKDSLNMQLGGSGPNNSKLNLDQYNGTGVEAHRDYNHAAAQDADADYLRRPLPERSASFNATAKTEPVHGEISAGLGTSTFLEGAPASRAAIQRREIEQEAADQAMAANLSRKKSLAQRIKSVRPRVNDTGRMTSPEPFPTVNATSPLGTSRSDQAGAANPFFKDYDKEYEKKGAQIAFAEEQLKVAPRARAPSSPKRGPLTLERKITAESGPPPEESKSGASGGFLSRVKSIKGARSKTRERRNTEASS